jgi:hypothetical protein
VEDEYRAAGEIAGLQAVITGLMIALINRGDRQIVSDAFEAAKLLADEANSADAHPVEREAFRETVYGLARGVLTAAV